MDMRVHGHAGVFNMRVWIINPFDNLPMEGYRPQRYWLMANAFASAGHDVVLWTQDWSHAKKSRREALPADCPFALRYVHVPGYGGNISLKRIWSHWRFARNWASEAAKMEDRPQLVIVSSPPLFIGGEVRRFCAEAKARYVVDIMDAWPETFERVVPRWVLGGMRAVAKGNYCGAAGITAVTKSYLSLARRYGAECPMHLCHHGIQLPERTDGAERGREPVPGRIRLVYIGNMSLSYDLATVVDAVKSNEDLTLELAGSGPDEPSLRRRAADCPRIRFHGYLGEGELRRLLASADVGVVPMFDESCVGVPYKLADYVAAGLPVASSLHGETAELLSEHKAGVTYEARNVSAFAEAVRGAALLGRSGASLAELFDSSRIYGGYVDFACSLP